MIGVAGGAATESYQFSDAAPKGLTLALTGTALAARSWEAIRLNYDVGTMGYLKGCVRGRTLRLGKMTLMLFAVTHGATEPAAMRK